MNLRIKRSIYITKAYLYLFLFAFLGHKDVFAREHREGGDGGGSGSNGDTVELVNPIGGAGGINSIGELLVAILDFVVRIGLPLITLAIIYSGFKFVTARGKPTEIETAKRNLGYVLVGAAIILGAKLLSLMITGTVNNIESGL